MLKKLPAVFMSLLEITLEAIAIVDDWWHCLAASRAVSQLLKHSPQELKNQALFQGWQGVNYENDWDEARRRGRGHGMWMAIDVQHIQRSIYWHFVAGVLPDCHLVMLCEGIPSTDVPHCHQYSGGTPQNCHSHFKYLTRQPALTRQSAMILTPSRSESIPSASVPPPPLRSPLLSPIDSQSDCISDSISDSIVTMQALPFAMLVLDSRKRIYAVNDAYSRQFGASVNPLGRSLLELWGQSVAWKLDPAFAEVENVGVPIATLVDLPINATQTRAIQVGIAISRPLVSSVERGATVPRSPVVPASAPAQYYYLSLFMVVANCMGFGNALDTDAGIDPAHAAAFSTAISDSPDGIARFNHAGHLLYANPRLMQWWNCSLNSILQTPYTEIALFQRWGKPWQIMFDRAFVTGQKQTLETRDLALDEDQVLRAYLIPELDAIGTVRSVLVIFHDLTAVKRAQQALVSQASREYTLRLVAQHIRESLDLDRILASAVTGIQRSLQADRVLIYRFASGRYAQIAWEAATSGYPVPSDLRQRRYCIPEPCHPLFLQTERTWIIPTLEAAVVPSGCTAVGATSEDLWRCLLASFGDSQAMGIQSQMVTVIAQEYPKQNPTVWGLLVVHSCTSQREWRVDEADLLQEVAGQLAIGIQHAELIDRLNQQSQHLTATNAALLRANTRLKELSELDGLTKIANRRHFDNMLMCEWQRLSRSKRPLSLILFDVDHFKQYNDTYGHPAGDECLIQIARIARKQLGRPTDLLARYGGEEFVVLLPETDVSGAITVAEAIRQAVWDLAIVHHHTGQIAIFVSISLGVASCIPGREYTPEAFLCFADRALYAAKERGRNRWVCANSSGLASK
jgi:diguanylate cyclase (GGDEF)-like protein